MLPLVVSVLGRLFSDEDRTTVLLENLFFVLLTHFLFPIWKTAGFAALAFIGLAFYETRSEYHTPYNSFGPYGAEASTKTPSTSFKEEGRSTHSSLSPVASPQMCSINSDSLSPLTSNKSDNPFRSRNSCNVLDVEKFYEETADLAKLHGRPMLYPCNLTHRRFHPFKNTFKYSYLYAGIPVGLQDTFPPLLSVGNIHKPHTWEPKAWFSIRAQDYLTRGGAELTLSQKLREFLVSEVNDSEYAVFTY